MLGRADRAERRTVERFQHAVQYVAGTADRGFRGMNAFDVAEAALGVERGELGANAEAAPGNRADAAPVAVHQLEDPRHEVLSWLVAVTPHGAHVLVFDLVPPFFQLADREQHAFQDVERLEAGDDDRDLVLRCDHVPLGPRHAVAGGARAAAPMYAG